MGAPWFPSMPELPESQRASASLEHRYEDVAQDGRLTVIALPHAVGEVVWRHRLSVHEASRVNFKKGVIPVLSRMVVDATEESVSVSKPLMGHGGYEVTSTDDRIHLDVYVSVGVGRVYADHIFTKPWGKAEDRRVTAVEGFGTPRPRPARPLTHAPPSDATLLDPEPVLDPVPILFGLMHTDSNQHVNSLVYVRLFEEALIRRHATPNVLARWLEITYRKPCFAGDRVRIQLQAFTRDGEVGAIGAFLLEDGGKPYAYITMGAR